MSVATSDTLFPTSFSDRLNTNYCATKDDALAIRQLLVEPRQELAEIDKEIGSLQERMEALGKRRNAVETFVESHTALMTPIRGVSDDVLAEIFVHCIPTDRHPFRSVAEAPLLLTRVSRRWRKVSLTTPRLWTALHIFIPALSARHKTAFRALLEQRRKGVEMWLGRSGDLPIDISLVVSPADPHFDAAYKPLVRTLASFSRRWQSLYLKMPRNLLEMLENSTNMENLLRLKSIKIDYLHSGQLNHLFLGLAPPHHQGPQRLMFSNVISKAPQLQSLSLKNPEGDAFGLPISWENLTELELTSRCPGQKANAILTVLSKASPALRSCTITLGLVTGNSTQQPNSSENLSNLFYGYIYFPHLQHLDVRPFHTTPMNAFGMQGNIGPGNHSDTTGPQKELTSFFAAITAPQLVSLSFSYAGYTANQALDPLPFIDMLLRTEDRVESLRLSTPTTTDALSECLRILPSLRSLYFQECIVSSRRSHISLGFQHGAAQLNHNHHEELDLPELSVFKDSIVELLTPSTENDELFCPHLQSLYIVGNIAAHEDPLIRLVKSRSPKEVGRNQELSPLKRLHVYFDRDPEGIDPRHVVKFDEHTADISAIRRFREEDGVDVMFSYPAPIPFSDSPAAGEPRPVGYHPHESTMNDLSAMLGMSLGGGGVGFGVANGHAAHFADLLPDF